MVGWLTIFPVMPLNMPRIEMSKCSFPNIWE